MESCEHGLGTEGTPCIYCYTEVYQWNAPPGAYDRWVTRQRMDGPRTAKRLSLEDKAADA